MTEKVKLILKKAKSESLGVCFYMKNDQKSEEFAWKIGFMQRLTRLEQKVREERQRDC